MKMNYDEDTKKIYIVASYCSTLPGKIICAQAKLKFWHRYDSKRYSHISVSLDDKLDNMMSFARKHIRKPWRAGLIREDIRTGVFGLRPHKLRIAIFAIDVTDEQYDAICDILDKSWEEKDTYKYNFASLFTMLFLGKGVNRKNRYTCSHWVADILEKAEIYYFDDKKNWNVKPFDFYEAMQDSIVYEGMALNYAMY